MPASDDKHLWVNWDEYHREIEALALLVHKSGWKFDQILCLARGGLRPGDVFSRLFQVPLAILSTSSYRAEAGTVQGEIEVSTHVSTTAGPLKGRILLIDDLADSGVTLKAVHRQLQSSFPEVTEVKTAVIWCKACSSFTPDYYLRYLDTSPWIHQPFEEYDGMTIEGLKRKWGE
ncbi:phosphoribosyltransferase [Lacisediminimonas profundi]|uniref:phosphoribosyltransferase n=1 Tax=Lacisediminimonas profundi TaxID=2603856 RepID=UPI00124B6155|nr:phosphoribosyltransferase [Lacisediminimonas profundi]